MSTGSFISSKWILFALLTPGALATVCQKVIRRCCSTTPALWVPLLGVLIGPVALNTRYMPRDARWFAKGTTKFWIQPLNWPELTSPPALVQPPIESVLTRTKVLYQPWLRPYLGVVS